MSAPTSSPIRLRSGAAIPGRRRILVTSALPYANGQIHIGHMVEYIQTDIWVRTLRMHGHEVYYVGADDTHGTPVMLRAEKEGHHAEAADRPRRAGAQARLRQLRHLVRQLLLDRLPKKTACCSENVYLALQAAGLIDARDIEQAYDPVKEMFLPDRFIKGECPKCGAKDQYGDSCEVCGSTYLPTELINPYSVVSGATPIRKTSTHYFFRLSDPRCENFLRAWVERPGAAGSDQQDARMARRHRRSQARRLGHFARRAVFRLRDPGRAGQVFLRVAGRAGRLLRELQESAPSSAASTSTRGFARVRRPSSITSSARTSCISTRCSGRRCSSFRATARRPTCSRTAS